MISTLYRGSVKDIVGPLQARGQSAVVFQYSDAYSVFDWGRMPDALSRKGEALAVLAADWFERLERPETWAEFSKTPVALALRKGNRFGAVFNELGEELKLQGLRTHYLGVLNDPKLLEKPGTTEFTPQSLSELRAPARQLVVRQVSVVKPALSTVLGRTIPDYLPTRNAPSPRLVPLEVVFRFGVPEGSSLFERTERDPGYLASIGFPEYTVQTGSKWEFPILELFTKLETSDRPVGLGEALAISGVSAAQLQDLLLKTAWIAGYLKWLCQNAGVELADGKLEWGLSADGKCILVDAIGPDELRLLKNGVQLSKEFLRTYYRKTPWFVALNQAKKQAKTAGSAEWKRLVGSGPPPLQPAYRELATQLYLALANELTGRKWFTEAWSLDQVTEELSKATE